MSSNQNSYIVVFKSTTPDETILQQIAQVAANGGKVTHTYLGSGLRGFAAEISPEYLLTLQSSLSQDDNQISFIEPDQLVTIQNPST
ncbi:hypothetical protein BC827DRAFT_332684 [Russula dissimulans]|nr:hypothetical protein BC827DRAFT_332684 [Russula dissimulans]